MSSASSTTLAFSNGGSLPELRASLWDWLVSDCDPEAPAVISLHQSASHLESLCSDPDVRGQHAENHLRWSYGELKTAALQVASFLSSQLTQKLGAKNGQHVIATFIWNRVEYALFFWAAIALGMPIAPLDPKFLDQPDEFQYFMECLEPSVVLVEDAEAAEKVNALGTNAHVKVICKCESDLDGWHRLERVPYDSDATQSHPRQFRGASNDNASMSKGPGKETSSDTLPEDTALIGFSSGTSGRPKGCPHTAYSFAVQVDGYLRMKPCRWSTATRNITVSLCFRPICHLSCFATWKCGGSVIFPAPSFDPAATIRAISSQSGTHIKLVPPQAVALIEDQTLKEARPSTLEFASIGGNIIGSGLLENFQKEFSVDRVLSIWGMSEGAGVIGFDREDEEIPANPHGLAALGRAFLGVKIRICDPQSEERKLVSRGVVGDFHISSPAFIPRYLFNRSAEQFYSDEQGSWYITEDHAKMDDSGVIYVVGRGKDSINRKGTILIPGNIEACLDKIPGIESQVVPVPDDDEGEVPVAIIKQWPKDGEEITKSTLEEAVIRDVGKEAALSDVHTLDELQMSNWPYNTTAKILKKDLTDAVVRLKEAH